MDNNSIEKIQEIKDWLQARKDSGCRGVVLGLSGGKDSTVVAMLAKEVWGDNVVALIMPNGLQKDLIEAVDIAQRLQIYYEIFPIQSVYEELVELYGDYSSKALSNVAPRLRMTRLYLVAQSLGYWVIGTGNLSEHYIGWCTKFGDMGCDFNPIAHLTCREVIQIGMILADKYQLPRKYISKTPEDGLTGKTDEENFGFTYDQLDDYITCGTSGDANVDNKIEAMHKAAIHKLVMPATIG